MPTTEPGPSSVIDAGGFGTYVQLGALYDKRDWLVRREMAHKTRVKTVTQIVNGEWSVVWPDLSRTPEAPTVANLVELGVAHWSSIGGAMLPSIKVPVHVAEDRSQGRTGARKRERRLRELWKMSNASEISALLWGDYAGAGNAVLGAWVNFEEDDASKRHPYMVRYDPRHTYIVKDNLGNVSEMLVARRISRAELAIILPKEYQSVFKASGDDEIEEWFWYTAKSFRHILVDVGKDGRKDLRNVVLVDEPNDLGFVPVAEAVRPTFDGQKRGIYDQTLHILHTMHKLMTLTIASAVEHSFPAILEYNIANPGEFGPGTIMHARSTDAKLERISPSSHFDVKDLIARMAEDATRQATYPQQLSGEPGASIVSSRGIKASMGALDARLALAHKQFEILFGKVSGFLLAMDETYCNGPKQIFGDSRDTRKAESFMPERDIAGAWEAECTYGIGAGSDPANVEFRLSMHLANRLISRETARDHLPFDDPHAEPIKILREAMQDALIMGVIAMAQQGNAQIAAQVMKLLADDKADIDAVVEQMVEFLAPPEPAQTDPLAAAQGAESLARGGVPGQAEQAPPGAMLPGLGEMMGRDNRMVV